MEPGKEAVTRAWAWQVTSGAGIDQGRSARQNRAQYRRGKIGWGRMGQVPSPGGRKRMGFNIQGIKMRRLARGSREERSRGRQK